MFSAPSPLPTALGVLCLSLSVLPLFLPFPLNFLPWDGGWGLKLSQGIAHTGRPMTGRDIVARVGRAEEPEKLGVGFGLLFPFLVGHIHLFPLSLVLLSSIAPVSAVHDFRRSSHPHAHARHLGFAHARAYQPF